MFSFSRNAYMVINSDAIHNKEDIIVDQSNFTNAKTHIQSEFEALNEQGYKIGLWYDEGNENLRTTEDYLDSDSLAINPSGLSKRKLAQRRVNAWGEDKKINQFNLGLFVEIKKLYDLIRAWQPD